MRACALLHVRSLQRQGALCKSYYCSSTSSVSCWWKTQFIHIVHLLGLPVCPSVRPPFKQACLLCCLVAMVSSRPPAHSALKDKVPTVGRVSRVSVREGFNAKAVFRTNVDRDVNCELTTDIEAASSSPTGSEGLASNIGRHADKCDILHNVFFCSCVSLPADFFLSNISSAVNCPSLQPVFKCTPRKAEIHHTRLIRAPNHVTL